MAQDAIDLPRFLVLLVRRALAPGPRPGGPRGEAAAARTRRWFADRRDLAEMDDRLLADIGLTRADLARGVPFRPKPPNPARCGSPSRARRPSSLPAQSRALRPSPT